MVDMKLSCTPREIGSCLIASEKDAIKRLKIWHRTLTAAKEQKLQLRTPNGTKTTVNQINDCLASLENAINTETDLREALTRSKALLRCYDIACIHVNDEISADKVRLTVIDELI